MLRITRKCHGSKNPHNCNNNHHLYQCKAAVFTPMVQSYPVCRINHKNLHMKLSNWRINNTSPNSIFDYPRTATTICCALIVGQTNKLPPGCIGNKCTMLPFGTLSITFAYLRATRRRGCANITIAARNDRVNAIYFRCITRRKVIQGRNVPIAIGIKQTNSGIKSRGNWNHKVCTHPFR